MSPGSWPGSTRDTGSAEAAALLGDCPLAPPTCAGDLLESLKAAVSAGDHTGIARLLDQAFALQDVEQNLTEVAQPLLQWIGDGSGGRGPDRRGRASADPGAARPARAAANRHDRRRAGNRRPPLRPGRAPRARAADVQRPAARGRLADRLLFGPDTPIPDAVALREQALGPARRDQRRDGGRTRTLPRRLRRGRAAPTFRSSSAAPPPVRRSRRTSASSTWITTCRARSASSSTSPARPLDPPLPPRYGHALLAPVRPRRRAMRKSRLLGLVAVFVLAAGGAATFAWAQARDATTIDACVANEGGAVRIVKAGATCRRNETAMSWNTTGPAGPAGAQGPAGPQGPPGASGGGGGGSTIGTIAITGASGPVRRRTVQRRRLRPPRSSRRATRRRDCRPESGRHKPFTVVLSVGPEDPLLMNALVTNENLTTVTISFFLPGTNASARR